MQALPASPLLSSTSSPPSLATVMAEQILPPPPPRGEIIIAIPIFKNFTALDAIGPYDSLKYLPNVKVFFVSHTKEPQLADSGTLQILPSHSFEDLPDPTIIIVPGGAGANTVALEDDEKGLHKEIIAWIQKAHKSTYMTTSVCTGALVLGAAGLLKGLNATTHHTAITLLREFGAIVDDIPERVIFQGKIATAAGVSSGIDFGVHLTRILADELTAKAVTFANEYAPEPPYDTGSIERADEDVQELSDKLYGDLLARPPQIPPFFR